MKRKCSGVFGLVLFATTLCAAPKFDAVTVAGGAADDVTVTEYSAKDASLVARVHAARLFRDFERHGFFRIGLLPVPVAEDVQIEIRSAECLTNALSALHLWNEPSVAVRRIELRNVGIGFLDEKQQRLSARLARVRRDGDLELFNVSLTGGTGVQTFIPEATLQTSSPSAGWIRWYSEGQVRKIFPFKPMSDK